MNALSGYLLDANVVSEMMRPAPEPKVAAFVMEERRQRSEPLDHHLPDAMLAGTALSRGLTIATRNEKEFRNTGVVVVNPWTRPAHPNR